MPINLKRMAVFASLFAIMAVILGSGLSFAAWYWLPYYNAYNLTVANWNYTNQGFSAPSGFVAIQIPNSINPYLISTRGYNNASANLGSIPYWVVTQYANAVVILMQNKTNESLAWTKATIYYNPISPTASPIYGSSTGLQSSFNTSVYDNQYVTIFGPLTIPRTTSYFTPAYSNSIYMQLNFTLNTTIPGGRGFTNSFVLFANRSGMVSRSFNISWSPNAFGTFSLNTSPGSMYKLTTLGLFGGSITNSVSLSPNGNFIFLGKGNVFKNEFEAWFSTGANQIYGEGMGKVGNTQICNSISCASTGANLNANPQLFTIRVDTNIKTAYYLMPAFTTNIVTSNTLLNPSPSGSTPSGSCSSPTLFYCFLYSIPITNIGWNYNFYSNATGSNAILSPVIYSFGSGKVGFLLLNVTHYSLMGSYCQNIYARDYNSTTKTDYGPIPFYVLNCSPSSSTAQILFENTTQLGYTFNSFNLYYDSGIITPAGSNLTVYKNWIVGSGQLFNSSTSQNAKGFLINLQLPLNANSVIQLGGSIPPTPGQSYVHMYSYRGNSAMYGTDGGGDSGGVVDYTGRLNQQILIFATALYAYPKMISNGIAYDGYVKNTTSQQPTYYDAADQPFYVNLSHTTSTATAFFLYTSNYLIGGAQASPTFGNSTLPTLPSGAVPPTIPQTQKGLNYSTNSVTVTINQGSTETIPGWGQTIPSYVFGILALIVMLFGAATLGNKEHEQIPFILILVGLWIAGIWQIAIVVIAFVGTLLYLLYEFS